MATSEENWAVKVEGLGKVYPVYSRPFDRLRELGTFGLRKFHDEAIALEDVNFTVAPGTTLGIIGRNGAGKSTLLKILSGNLSATSGTVRVRGRLSSILELGMGFQPNLTGRQNLKINALLLGMEPSEIAACTEQVIEFSELPEGKIDQPIHTYSSGQGARLAFSILTAVRSDVIILDEALATGDAGFAEKGRSVIQSLVASGATVLVVSHNLKEVENTCDRVIWLSEGRLVEDGDPERVIDAYAMSIPELAALRNPEPPPPPLWSKTGVPTRLMFRLDAPESLPEEALFEVSHLSWVDEVSGCELGRCRPADEVHEREMILASRESGLTEAEARLGWGEVNPVEQSRQFLVRAGSPCLPIRAPLQGDGGPVAIRIRFRDSLSAPLDFCLVGQGITTSLAKLGGKADGTWQSETVKLPAQLGFAELPRLQPDAAPAEQVVEAVEEKEPAC